MGTSTICFVVSVISLFVGGILTFMALGLSAQSSQGTGWPAFAADATCFLSFLAGMHFIRLDRLGDSLDRIAKNGEQFNRKYGIQSVRSASVDEADENEPELPFLDRLSPSQQLAMKISLWLAVVIVIVALLVSL